MDFLCSFALIAALFSACLDTDGAPYPGYVEGEYVQLAPVAIARIDKVRVSRGDRIQAGQIVADLDSEDAAIAVRDAEAKLAEARARLSDLERGQRPEEIAALEASVRASEAQVRQAESALTRQRELQSRGVASRSDLDRAQEAYDVAVARTQLARANVAVARLPARADDISAARKRIDQALANLDNARWALEQRRLKALSAGLVSDILHRPGETAGPSAPVLSYLPDGAVKLRFYVPEAALPRMAVGRPVSAACDGCADPLPAVISYVAEGPEFTPPVIYSDDSRQKLRYLIEAVPGPNSGLKPGQIVDVSPADTRADQ